MGVHKAPKYELTVQASCWIVGDEDVRVDFDATPWFRSASDQKIEALFRIGLTGDHEATLVSSVIARRNEELRALADRAKASLSTYTKIHLDTKVDIHSASRWVRENRPELADKLEKEGLLSR